MPDPTSLVQYLRADPTLRFTETGRTLLRLLNVHAMSDEEWATIVQNVPAHCRDAIANMALECARIWRMFAEQLEHNAPGRAQRGW
jgi:hypothetical protein